MHEQAQRNSFSGWTALLLVGLALLCMALVSPGNAATKGKPGFDHNKTGFTLSGAHEQAKCESCHIKGVFKQTPKLCEGCHVAGSPVPASTKPVKHLSSGNACGDCHSSSAWSPTHFDHTGTTASCDSCHNGKRRPENPPTHITTSAACSDCHTTVAWSPSHFDHSGSDRQLRQLPQWQDGDRKIRQTPYHQRDMQYLPYHRGLVTYAL